MAEGIPATPKEVEMFLGNYPVEPKAVLKLKELDPYQQKAVISRGSLAEARDPTAVLISRCKKAVEGTMATSPTVLVRGMDFGTTEEQLQNHMSSVGAVENVKWITKGTAEVTYSSADEAVLARDSLNQSIIPGNTRYIDVIPQDVGQSNWSEGPKGVKRSAPPGSMVYVRGFDFGTTQEEFESHMSSVGTIISVHLCDKGSAEIAYSNPQEAAMAVQQLNNTTIPGNTRYIDVLKQEDSQSSAKRGKAGGGDQTGSDDKFMMLMMKMMLEKGSGRGASNSTMMELMKMMLEEKMGSSAKVGPSQSSWPSSNASPEKQALIAKVKSFQKSSQQNKQTWYSFCETQPLGKYDPSKYEPSVLKMFLASVGHV